MVKLKVYYGWARIGKIRKKRALSVIFEKKRSAVVNSAKAVVKQLQRVSLLQR